MYSYPNITIRKMGDGGLARDNTGLIYTHIALVKGILCCVFNVPIYMSPGSAEDEKIAKGMAGRMSVFKRDDLDPQR